MPPFLPLPDFLAFVDGLPIHEHAKENLRKPYFDSLALSKAMCGPKYSTEAHGVLYRSTAHPQGSALAFAAWTAVDGVETTKEQLRRIKTLAEAALAEDERNDKAEAEMKEDFVKLKAHLDYLRDLFGGFTASLRCEGLTMALEAWSRSLKLDGDFQWDKELKWANRTLVGNDEIAANFWLGKCQELSSSPDDYDKLLRKEKRNASATKRDEKKRRDKGVKEKHSEFKDRIQAFWVPAALWQLSDSSIVSTLRPGKPVLLRDTDLVKQDIAVLGMSASRARS
jgi:hypothetical protein